MTEINNKRFRRVVAGLGAMSIVGMGLIGTGLTASAEGTVGVDDIDTTHGISLTLEKHENQKDPAANKGKPDGTGKAPQGPPIADVQFTAYPLYKGGQQVDLTKSESWQGLDKLQTTVSAAGQCDLPDNSGYSFKTAEGLESSLTLADGKAVIQNKEATKPGYQANFNVARLYLVCETKTPPSNGTKVVEKSAPFVVAMPTPWEGTWLYDVFAYPKNAIHDNKWKVREPEQRILDYPYPSAGAVSPNPDRKAKDLVLGSTIKLQTKVQLPNAADVTLDPVKSMGLEDNFPAGLDPVLDNSGAPVQPQLEYSADGTNASYTTMNSTWYSSVWTSDHNWQLTLTSDGVDAVKALAVAGTDRATIRVTHNATVSKVGEHTNVLTQYINDPIGTPENTDPTKIDNVLPSNAVYTKWGDLNVLKVDSKVTDRGLKGAEFEVYAANASYPENGKCTSIATSGDALPTGVSAATDNTTDKHGKLKIDGLFVSNSDLAKKGPSYRCYVLKETKAPQGYTLPEGNDAYTAVTVKVGIDNKVEIRNTVADLPDLPLTGAAGTKLLIAGGAALVLLAMGLFMVRRHRENESA